MARAKQQPVEKATYSGVDDIERFKLGEIGFNGLNIFDGVSTEELKRELRHPAAVQTYKDMSYHPAINAALSLYLSMISKATFRVLPPKDSTQEEKQKAELVQTMLHDMDIPFEDFLVDAMSMSTHGFSVVEKVYRRRTKANGSQYDDGVIGIKKLAHRNQESIEKFIFDDSGNDVVAVKQNLSGLGDPYGRYVKRKDLEVVIPRKKFMLFNVGRTRNNPYGTSPLRDVYVPWRYITAIEELEATGVAKDLQGVPVMKVPAQYMSADASPEQKVLFEQFKNIVRNLQQNTQSGVILPSAVDPDTRQALFSLELLSTEGGKKAYDTTKIKEYYRGLIFIGLSADILLMGNTTTGSFALGNIKTSLTANVVEGYLRRICQVINEDLIRQIYELNAWDVTRRCTLDYEGFEDTDLESLSKYVQRIGAVGFLPKTADVVNKVLAGMGVDALPEGTDLTELLGENTSRSGDGMREGLPSGTGSAVGNSGDSSANNADNAS